MFFLISYLPHLLEHPAHAGKRLVKEAIGEMRSLSPIARTGVLAILHAFRVARRFLDDEPEKVEPRLLNDVMHLALDLNQLRMFMSDTDTDLASDEKLNVLVHLLVSRLEVDHTAETAKTNRDEKEAFLLPFGGRGQNPCEPGSRFTQYCRHLWEESAAIAWGVPRNVYVSSSSSGRGENRPRFYYVAENGDNAGRVRSNYRLQDAHVHSQQAVAKRNSAGGFVALLERGGHVFGLSEKLTHAVTYLRLMTDRQNRFAAGEGAVDPAVVSVNRFLNDVQRAPVGNRAESRRKGYVPEFLMFGQKRPTDAEWHTAGTPAVTLEAVSRALTFALSAAKTPPTVAPRTVGVQSVESSPEESFSSAKRNAPRFPHVVGEDEPSPLQLLGFLTSSAKMNEWEWLPEVLPALLRVRQKVRRVFFPSPFFPSRPHRTTHL